MYFDLLNSEKNMQGMESSPPRKNGPIQIDKSLQLSSASYDV